jgi:hypothetical protein
MGGIHKPTNVFARNSFLPVDVDASFVAKAALCVWWTFIRFLAIVGEV